MTRKEITPSQGPIVFSLFAAVVTGCAILNLYGPRLADFRVYWFGINRFLHESKPLYGMEGGLGYPMLFRYPPPFVVLFRPIADLSFRAAGTVWIIGEWFSLLGVTVWAARELRLRTNWQPGLLALLVIAPYIFLSFKDGNAQWLAAILLWTALINAESRPRLGGLALAIAIAVKVWPILFLPLFISRERRKCLFYTGLWSAAIWTLPLLVFGAAQYRKLLLEWGTQEFANHIGTHDIWYPSQSLRGLLLRLFTDPAVTLPYRSEFPDIHLLALSPQAVVSFATFLSALAFLYVLWRAVKSRREQQFEWDAIYFVAFSAFQPFCNRASLISLLPAAIAAAQLLKRTRRTTQHTALLFRAILLCLCVLEIASSLSRQTVKWFEVLGLHFPIMICLGAIVWLTAREKESATEVRIQEPG